MRLFFELTRRSFRRYLTYRAAAFAGLFTNFVFGLMRLAVLLALYGERQEVAGITVSGIITYAAMTQAVIAYLSLFGWYDLSDSVHSGEVGSDLLKPMSYLSFWLAQDLGRAAVNLLLRGFTIMFAYGLMFELDHPNSPGQWLVLCLSVVLSWLVSFAWRFLINLPAFWTPNARGIGRFGFMMSWFLSGVILPLRLLPDWTVRLAYLTPFPHMINTVVEVYLGVLQGPELAANLLLQAAWALGLLLSAHLILKLAVRRLVILGG
jgi:ABC-2 type transport system permease protein